jgi:hypothetical protein
LSADPSDPGAASAIPSPSPGELLATAFPIGGLTTVPWREQALTRAAELRTMASWARLQTAQSPAVADALTASIQGHLDTAREAAAASRRQGLVRWVRAIPSLGRRRRSLLERVMTNLNAAEVALLRLAPSNWLRGQVPSLVAHVRRHLPEDDPRRISVDEISGTLVEEPNRDLKDLERDTLVSAASAANSQQRRDAVRLHGLRNILLVPIALLTIAAVVFAIVGLWTPEIIPLCFEPEGEVVCPTSESQVPMGESPEEAIRATASGGDIVLIEMVGIIAASVAAAIALRSLGSTSSLHDFPVLLALLRLPTGAVTAVLGLLLMRAGFIPGLSALDSSAQIIAWAVVLGYSQQLFTRVVDSRARAVIEDVAAGPSEAATPESTRRATLA